MGNISILKQLDQLLRYPKGRTINELLLSLNEDITKRMLQKYIVEIQKPPYNAVLEQNLYRGRARLYKYKDLNFSLDVLNTIDDSEKRIHDVIENLANLSGDPQYDWLRLLIIELKNGLMLNLDFMEFDRNLKLKGIDLIENLADAIIHKYPLRMNYKSFNGSNVEYYVHPYYLKEYNKRWFLIGGSGNDDTLYNYPLDRIESIEHLSIPFVETKINFKEYFKDIIGVTVKDLPAEKIVIKISKEKFPYFRTKPLHSSQEINHLLSSKDYTYVSIKVIPNYELQSLLLSFGDEIEIVEPQWLRDELKCKIRKMLSHYE